MTGKIITIANWKGGVGKTTLAIAIADALVSMQKHVSFFDLDPQGTASRALLGKDERQGRHGDEFENRDREDMNLYGLLTDRLKKKTTAKSAAGSGVDAHDYRNGMVHFFRDHGTVGLRLYPNSSKSWELEKSQTEVNGGARLGAAMKTLLMEESLTGSTVVVDCPPSPTACTVAAMSCSDIVLCPTTPDQFAVWGKDEFSKFFEERVRKLAPKVVLKFVVTRYTEKGKEALRILEQLRVAPDGKGSRPEMLCIEGGVNQRGVPAIASFSEREIVRQRLMWKDSDKGARSLKDIYGPGAEELRHIVIAIFRELKAGSSMQSSGG